MKQIYPIIGLIFFVLYTPTFVNSQQLTIDYLSTYSTGIFDEGAAEIVAYDKGSERLFSVNGDNKTIDVLDISDPAIPNLLFQIDVTAYGGNVNSVAVHEGIVAAAIENSDKQAPGLVAFFDVDGNFLNSSEAGALPDMLLFTADGQRVLVANEGEPNDDYTIDPEGSVTIVDLSAGIGSLVTTQISFSAYNNRKASLINKGVRIFGNNGLVTVAQDLEPEYIALSEDGSIAYVSCQENNALVIVDLTTATVTDILALGYKDHQKGAPQLTEYLLNEIPWFGVYDLGTPLYDGGETIKLGGFSGLCYDPLTSTENQLSFWAVPDRGPNEATVNAGLSQNLRPFKLPNYQARLVKLNFIKSLNMFFIDANPIFLTRADGVTPISGRGNIPGYDEVPVTRTDETVFSNSDYSINDIDYHALEYDAFGGDFEGVIRVVDYDTKDFSFWLCDEYRPAIYHFKPNGTLIERYVPEGTSLLGDTPQAPGYYGAETLPAVYNKRRANRGFEAIAHDTDENIIYAFIQTPLYNPDNSTRNNSDVIRILGIDPANGQPVKEYVYLLERNKDDGIGLSRVDKIGDAVYAGKGKFYVLERDSSTPDDGDTGKKYIFEINLKGATNILGSPLSQKTTSSGTEDKTLEMMTADDLADAGIQPVFKVKVLNLPSIGYLPSDKPEGLALLPNGDLVVLNDNDFGLAGAGVSDNSSVGFIEFQHNYGMDPSNRDDKVEIRSVPTLGMYQPDAIASYSVNGKTFIVTANEGDARDYDGYSEEDRVKDLDLDPDCFVDAASLQEEEENLGRLNTTLANGDIDQDGLHDYIFSYGARSFSIWDEYGNLVYDSADEFAQYIAANYTENFNSNNDDNDSQDARSDDKGTEPEAVTIAELNGITYAFIGLERMGGVMVYDISNPKEASFVTYINNRDFSADAESAQAGDLGVEDIIIIPAENSPNGLPLMVTANEVSGTISLFTLDLDGGSTFMEHERAFIAVNNRHQQATGLEVFPNPFVDEFAIQYDANGRTVIVTLYNQTGQTVETIFSGLTNSGPQYWEVNLRALSLPSGIYTLSILEEGQPAHSVRLIKK